MTTTRASKVTKETRIAAYAVCVADGRVLLARWVSDGTRRWTLPGGGINHGEDPLDATIREVAEETGYDVAIDSLLGIDSQVNRFARPAGRQADFHGLRIVYAGHVTGGELQHEVDGSTDMAAWFDLDQVASLDRVSLVDIGIALHRARPADGRMRRSR